MEVTFTGKRFEVTDALKRYTQKKLEKYDKQLRRITSVHVVQSTERNWHKVDVTVAADGTVFRGEGKSDNMYNSVDIAVAKLETQIKHRKGKLIDRAHGRTPEGRPAEPEIEAEGLPATEEIEDTAPAREVRIKRVQLTPMSVDEAIDEMELMEQQFFVFANAETGQVNVVYRRNQGGYGLIEPDY